MAMRTKRVQRRKARSDKREKPVNAEAGIYDCACGKVGCPTCEEREIQVSSWACPCCIDRQHELFLDQEMTEYAREFGHRGRHGDSYLGYARAPS